MVARSTLRMALLYPNALAQVKIFLPSCRKGPNKRSSPVIRLGPNRHRHSCRAKTWHRALFRNSRTTDPNKRERGTSAASYTARQSDGSQAGWL